MIKTPPPGWKVLDSGKDGFLAESKNGKMRVVVSWGDDWEHVSVSHKERCPIWEEMEYIARHFWPTETAMQLHVSLQEHINIHPFCLHWWRPVNVEIPKPPGWMV